MVQNSSVKPDKLSNGGVQCSVALMHFSLSGFDALKDLSGYSVQDEMHLYEFDWNRITASKCDLDLISKIHASCCYSMCCPDFFKIGLYACGYP